MTHRRRLKSRLGSPEPLPGSSDVICGIRATARRVHPQAKRRSPQLFLGVKDCHENKPESDLPLASPARRIRLRRTDRIASIVNLSANTRERLANQSRHSPANHQAGRKCFALKLRQAQLTLTPEAEY